ncbi:flagellin N-terminal helical domain-containing protein [Methylobacterium sp. Leaf99]|uniref:flagellin N-terminal helical domain-containing protein n=1 Tax=Methylobacterium sp. Leaf99 TaxID=1736251 RepID=UPI0009EC1725|nr:flagellin [Methylobacterium sp. Leaf99]
MSSGVTLTAATRQNLLSLQGTADLLSSTQNRLSTGKKVNSALDDPTSFFTSQALSGRSGDLGSLLNGISNGVQTIQAANQGITSIQKLVDSAKSTANQALADKSAVSSGTPAAAATLSAGIAYQGSSTAATDGTQNFSTGTLVFTLAGGSAASIAAPTTITLNASTLGGLTSDVSKVSADTVVTAINNQLSNASVPTGVTASKTTDGRIVFTSSDTGAASKATFTVTSGDRDIGFGVTAGAGAAKSATGADAKNSATAAVATAGTAFATTVDLSAATAATFDIQLGSGPKKSITVADGATANATTKTEILTSINNQLNADTGFAGKVAATFVNNKLTFTTTGTGSSEKVTVSNAAGADVGFGTAGTATVPVVGSGEGSASGTNATRTSLAKQFNTLLDQITQQAKDSSYNGINLLYRSGTNKAENSLKVTFNETGSSSLNIEGAKLDADGLGLGVITGNFQSDDEINKALTAITTATSQLRGQSSTFGSNLSVVQNRQDFSKNLINILDTGSANLTNADLNEEAANSQALSTRQSIGISALSLANTAQQGILQLLR